MQNPPSNRELILRLLRFAWQFRARSIQVITSQIGILLLTIGGFGLTGLAIDLLSDEVRDTSHLRWPFGWTPPDAWSPFELILLIGFIIICAALLRAVLEYFHQMAVGRLVHIDIVLKLRAQVYEKMQHLSFRFFDKTASGTLINRVTSDVQAVRMFIDQVIVQIFIMVISLGVYLAYMLNMHVKLTIACLITTPVLWLLSALFSSLLHPAYLRSRELMDDLILSFSENIQGIQTIKSFCLENRQSHNFKTANEEVREQRQGIFWLVSTFSPGIGFLTQVNLIILLGYGGYLVLQGELPLGTGLVVFAVLLQQFSTQISNIAGVADSIQQSLTGARRVFEILDTPVEIKDPTHPKPLARVKGEVRFEHVFFEYKPQNIILHDIDFTASPGKIIAIAGATGSGKSALMSLIPRFYDPQNGHILLDGVDIRDVKVDSLRRNVGIVFQENFLFSNSVAANIAFGCPEATHEQIRKAAKIACAHDFIEAMPNGYNTVLSESGMNLSGGQRQRLAIARAVLLEPQILLLDDPTAAIDPETEHEIMEAIDSAIQGRTTFIVAHRLSTLKRADFIMVFDHGHIIQSGSHPELMQQDGLYRSAVQLQAVDPTSLALLTGKRQHIGGAKK